MSYRKSVWGCAADRIASRSAAISVRRCVTSRPMSVTLAPLLYSSSAASGSPKMFASADGFTLPFTKNAPPRWTISCSFEAMAGSWRKAMATLVAEASATTVISPGCLCAISMMKSAAVLPCTAAIVGAGWDVLPKPSSPCTKSAMRSLDPPMMDTNEPSTTGMSGRPNFSSRYSELCVAILVRTLPNSDVSPTTSTSGLRSASKMAHESSTPGSVSMITFFGPII
mmetsp:Transcript_37481/g.92747  ORF Transcript_37481/g.92747 Transcript_37481/m.92747 type:complete len:226 (-) Transcript_37481:136-813(-)